MFLFPVENMEDFFQVYNYIHSDQNRGEFSKDFKTVKKIWAPVHNIQEFSHSLSLLI